MKLRDRSVGSARAVSFLGLLAPFVCAGCGADASSDLTAAPSDVNEQPQEEAFPGQSGEVRSGIFDTRYGPQELTYELINGERVFQGDMILPPEEPDFRSAGVSAFTSRWPNALIVVGNGGIENDRSSDPRVVTAMKHWMERTPVRFTFESVGGRSSVVFRRSTDPGTCSTTTEGVVGGRRPVTTVLLGSDCSVSAVIHEIGHVLGLFHEQSRTDRNSFVRVNTGCIKPGDEHNFAMFGSNGLNIGPYDIRSVMHYSSTADLDTLKQGCTATITRLDGTTFSRGASASGGDIAGIQSLYLAWWLRLPAVDWDQDGRADLAIWRPSNATWMIVKSSNGGRADRRHGLDTDVPVAADYDDDFKADHAVWRPTTGEWFVINSRTNTQVIHQWGVLGDIPVPGDYTGDGFVDRAVWRPNEGSWYVFPSTTPTIFGLAGDVPVPGDYDRDFVTDFAVWRPSNGTWFVRHSSTGREVIPAIQWGLPGDIPLPADYDGDGFTDQMVWRPSDGGWYFRSGRTGATNVSFWGVFTDVPAPADYDGDGRADLAVWRPKEGNWYIVNSGTGVHSVIQHGNPGDTPVP